MIRRGAGRGNRPFAVRDTDRDAGTISCSRGVIAGVVCRVRSISNSPSEIGRRKRRRPALPGLTNQTPSRSRIFGACEWPDTTTRTPVVNGSIAMSPMS